MAFTLYLVRHAKSDWSDEDLSDHDRFLNPRGLRQAPKMGRLLREMGVQPAKIQSSTAIRARHTAELFAEQLGFPLEQVHHTRELYEASVRSALAHINAVEGNPTSLMLFGHNPTWTYLGELLSGMALGNVPTSGVVAIKFKLDSWAQVSQNTGTLQFFEYPRKHEF